MLQLFSVNCSTLEAHLAAVFGALIKKTKQNSKNAKCVSCTRTRLVAMPSYLYGCVSAELLRRKVGQKFWTLASELRGANVEKSVLVGVPALL